MVAARVRDGGGMLAYSDVIAITHDFLQEKLVKFTRNVWKKYRPSRVRRCSRRLLVMRRFKQ
jgi:hypothetical protein